MANFELTPGNGIIITDNIIAGTVTVSLDPDVGVQGFQGPRGFQGVTGTTGSAGSNGVQGNAGVQGVTGTNGNAGVQGLAGNAGSQGFTGNAGVQGVDGVDGTKGFQGNDGQQGLTGDKGFQGVTGSQGFTGAQGIAGNIGVQGNDGAKGFQGLAGDVGVQGFTGIQGSIGNNGVQGNVGSQGFTGNAGVQGVAGSTGNDGVQGVEGTKGFQGVTGAGVQGFTGVQGVDGTKGYQGPAPDTSVYELKANKGVQSGYASLDAGGLVPSNQIPPLAITNTFVVTNLSDLTGLTTAEVGDVGIVSSISKSYILQTEPYSTSGNWKELLSPPAPVISVNGQTAVVSLGLTDLNDTPANSAGVLRNDGSGNLSWSNTAGPQGFTGFQGFTGVQGSAGDKGVQGVTGNAGAQGVTGNAGAQGNIGAQGNDGIKGFQGNDGTKGFQGLTGDVGVQGFTGIQGLTGTGVQGNEGIQGFTGFQGSVGNTGPQGVAAANDVIGPQSNTDSYVPQWDGANSNTLKNGLAVGTQANNLVQLDGNAKLPAIDGSQLVNLTGQGFDGSSIRLSLPNALWWGTVTGLVDLISWDYADLGYYSVVVTTGQTDSLGGTTASRYSGSGGAYSRLKQQFSGLTIGRAYTFEFYAKKAAPSTTVDVGVSIDNNWPGVWTAKTSYLGTLSDGLWHKISQSFVADNGTLSFWPCYSSSGNYDIYICFVTVKEAATTNTYLSGATQDMVEVLDHNGASGGKIKADGFQLTNLNPASITATSPSGKFLRDDGTWQTGTGGAQGFTGSQGNTGVQGLTGSTGVQGFTGVQGLTGNAGVQGFTGSTGGVGVQGFTGSTGNAGVQGFTGSIGNAGVQGLTGNAGVQGYTGSQGFTGSTGGVGVQGFTGSIGNAGVQGFTGSTGNAGVQGFTGNTGNAGVQGFTGNTGNAGVQGFTGNTGNTGVQGFTGTQGVNGMQGFTGLQGFQGPQGLGFQGASGGTVVDLSFNTQTVTYILALADDGKVVTMNTNSSNSLYINTDANINFTVGAQIIILQIGAGQTTIQATTPATTTINSAAAVPTTPKLRAQYSSAVCLKGAADVWYVFGDII
jgi:hypothetical protein